jgi:hypothetical protein
MPISQPASKLTATTQRGLLLLSLHTNLEEPSSLVFVKSTELIAEAGGTVNLGMKAIPYHISPSIHPS